MIPEEAIKDWAREAPWGNITSVEQDLALSRALVDIYSAPEIAERLAFRGGTALHKIHIRPAARHSEDIDLVHIHPAGIAETMGIICEILNPWLGKPKYGRRHGNGEIVYKFESENNPSVMKRLKIDINGREHFTEIGYRRFPFVVENRWFSGRADVTSFSVEEILGTKLRALYQRRKGRDLFDLWYAIDQGIADQAMIIRCFERYMNEEGHAVSPAEFETNLHKKVAHPLFRDDMNRLLRPGLTWDIDEGLRVVLKRLVAELPGKSGKTTACEKHSIGSAPVPTDAEQG